MKLEKEENNKMSSENIHNEENFLVIDKEEFNSLNGHIINDNGDEQWFFQGLLHREGAPAVIVSNDSKWFLNNNNKIQNKENNKSIYWYFMGKLHNENGPAIIHSNGQKEYYLKGIKYNKKEFLEYKKINQNFFDLSYFSFFSFFKNLFC